MTPRLSWLLAAALSVIPFWASADIADDVERMVVGRDFPALERTFDALHAEAIQARDFASAFEAMSPFVNTTSDREEIALAWLSAFPNSDYAHVALAKLYYHRAFQIRGPYYGNQTAQEAFDGFYGHMYEAYALLDAALALQPDNYVALYQAISVHQAVGDKREIARLAQRGLEIAPERYLIQRSLASLQLRWGASLRVVRELTRVCGRLTGYLPDYSVDSCVIEAVFENNPSGKPREIALQMLDDTDDPGLDWVRYMAHLREWRDRDGAMDKAIAYHRDTRINGALVTFEEEFSALQSAFQSKDPERVQAYAEEAWDLMIAEARRRIDYGPWNVAARIVVIKHLMRAYYVDPPREIIDEAFEHFVMMQNVGLYRSDTWMLGGRMANWASQGVDQGMHIAMLQNAVHYANYQPEITSRALRSLYSRFKGATPAWTSAEDRPKEMICPMIRMARLFQAVCEMQPGGFGCNHRLANTGKTLAQNVLEMPDAQGMCQRERLAEPGELIYRPTYVDDILSSRF